VASSVHVDHSVLALGGLVVALAATALYLKSRRGDSEATKFERVAAFCWVWTRRFVSLLLGMMFAFVSYRFLFWEAKYSQLWWIGVGLVCMAVVLLYFFIVGQGPRRFQWRDDIARYKQNRERYRWWF
jgi:hypothetical protein